MSQTPDPDRSGERFVPSVSSAPSDIETSAKGQSTDVQNDEPDDEPDGEPGGESEEELNDGDPDMLEAQIREDLLVQKTQAWALWRIFVAPHQQDLQRLENQDDQEASKDEDEQDEQGEQNEQGEQGEQDKQGEQGEQDEQGEETGFSDSGFSPDDYIPASEEQRRLGLMSYVRNEKGLLGFDELLCTDLILKYRRVLTPTTPGVDRYDDWGISHWEQNVSLVMRRFFYLSPQQRRQEWEEVEGVVSLSPEINAKMQQLKELLELPVSPEAKNKTVPETESSEDQSDSEDVEKTNDENETTEERMYPLGVKGLEAEFDALSGSKTSSSQLRAIETLDLLLSEESDMKTLKNKVNKLLRRYPVLERCNPYLLKLIRSGPDALSVNAQTSEDYSTINTHPTPFYFPAWLDDPRLAKSASRQDSWKNVCCCLAFVLTIVWLALLWGFYQFLNLFFPLNY